MPAYNEWELVSSTGDIPSPRFDFSYPYSNYSYNYLLLSFKYAYDAVTSNFYLFGGQGPEEMLGDFYVFNTGNTNK